ncbi:MAG: response regulator, partial [bacterium]|nr:response regulator [bacterium]
FTHKGEVSLRVRMEKEKDNTVYLTFHVKDTGIGIPEEKINGLFEAFTQVDGFITSEYGGTGLGLAIAKQLVDMMEGEITAQSRFGEGSTFHFSARLEKQEPKPEALQGKGDTSDHAGHRWNGKGIGNLHILLAEDNPINRKLALKILEKIGCRADVAESGIQALHAVQTTHYDIVLMDVQMPEMDGITAARKIRQYETRRDNAGLKAKRPPVYIIAITANAIKGDREKCLEAGMNDYISKPIKTVKLNEAIHRGAGYIEKNLLE